MGKIGKCCCIPPTDPDCLCDEAWDITNWSASVFGGSFSGDFTPAIKPVPFTLENSCHIRSGVSCDYDAPNLVVDTLINVSWTSDELPPFARVCNCASCGYGSLKGKLWGISDASSSRVAVWHHVQRYATATMYNCGDGFVKFVFSAIYSVTRMTKAMQRNAVRYKEYEVDCAALTATAIGSYVYDFWNETSYIIDNPPSLPCAWPQLNTAGACHTESNSTEPPCNYLSPGVSSRDETKLNCVAGVCTEQASTGEYRDSNGDVDFGCECNAMGACTFGIPFDATFGINAQRREYTVNWESDCISCDDIATMPDTITLDRVSASISLPSTGDVTAFMYSSVPGGFCGTIPAVSVLIPFNVTLNLS